MSRLSLGQKAGQTVNTNSQIKFKTTMLKSICYDYNDGKVKEPLQSL